MKKKPSAVLDGIPLKRYLRSTEDGPNGKLYTAKASDTIEEGLLLLAGANVLSLPLANADGKFDAFVDVLDILAELHKAIFPDAEMASDAMKRMLFLEPEGLNETVQEKWQTLKKVSLGDIANLSGRDAFVTLPATGSLGDAARLMADKMLHRVGLVDSESKNLVGLVTQSDVVRALHKHLGDIDTEEISHPIMVSHNALTVDAGTPAILGFIEMYKARVSAFGVVENKTQLVGQLSTHDLKELFMKRSTFLAELFMTSRAFSDHLAKSSTRDNSRTLVTAPTLSTMKDVIELLAKNRAHRVYLVQEEGKHELVGVCSITDVILSAAVR